MVESKTRRPRLKRDPPRTSALAVLFLTFDSIGKLLEVPPVVAGSRELGYPASTVFPIGAILLLCVVTYAIPRTSVLGALLLTGTSVARWPRTCGWATLLSHALFPVYVAFMRSMVGVPAPFVGTMKLMPWIWRKMKAVAQHSLECASRWATRYIDTVEADEVDLREVEE